MRRIGPSPGNRLTELVHQCQSVSDDTDASVLEDLMEEVRHSTDHPPLEDVAMALLPVVPLFVREVDWAIIRPLVELYLHLAPSSPLFASVVRDMGRTLMLVCDEFCDCDRIDLITLLTRILERNELVWFASERLSKHENLSYGERLLVLEVFARNVNEQELVEAIRSDGMVRQLFDELVETYEDECDEEDEEVPDHVEWLRRLMKSAGGWED